MNGGRAEEQVWLGDRRNNHSIHLRNQDLVGVGETYLPSWMIEKSWALTRHIPLWATTPNEEIPKASVRERQWLRWKHMKDA